MPEENFNKSLLLIIINDSQVIVRVLNSNSDIPYFITAKKRDIIQAIISFDVKILNYSLDEIGSLYYSRDIPSRINHLLALELRDACGCWVLESIID
ncbi:hypothetical protein CIRG_09420 [Coccidioides immitis RMSCC 2394]|uniref:Uncharacterized protein n=1 Tax=Coccidioides immitis RMSCC 2394 TaxID=404692 RepID=A0A0J6YNG9_COCIT|nr:hypothetical protein CIRG_09420 [Coccidioides immitis RMSCC 2394]